MANAPPPTNTPPPLARTNFQFIAGVAGTFTEARWTVDRDSPLVSSLTFLPWVLGTPPARSTVPRSAVVAAILAASRRPDHGNLTQLSSMSFLTHELRTTDGSAIAHAFDCVGLFDQVFSSVELFVSAAQKLWSKLASPNAGRLQAAMFYETANYSTRQATPPAELAFLHSTSLGQLVDADAGQGPSSSSLALARATILAASKEAEAERTDESSTIRRVAERVRALLLKSIGLTTASDAGLATIFCEAMASLHLPACFEAFTVTPTLACAELEAAYRYAQGTGGAVRSIEQARILRVGRVYPALRPLLERYSDAEEAWVGVENLAAALLPGALSSASTVAKLSTLNNVLGTAAWSSMITHAINADATIRGNALVELLLRSQSDLSVPASGGAASAASAGGGASSTSTDTYGSIRDAALADALRTADAQDALDKAEDCEGVERVETFMQSGSTVLQRAMLFQESWLHNKASALSICSLDRASLCQYFAQAVGLDDRTDEVPTRVKSYVFPESYLATIRSGKWSKLPFIDIALAIKSLLTGATFLPVPEHERYTVGSCLREIREIGAKLFFALGLHPSPQAGHSFTDGVDLQIRAVDFARTLPVNEMKDRLKFLSQEFTINFLDGGGSSYLAKIHSGRPDLPAARLDEFVGLNDAYFYNVETWLQRTEPVADLRAALPTILGSAPVALPGTSSASPRLKPGKEGGDGGDKSGGKPKGKGKVRERETTPKGGGDEPGSKAHFAHELSSSELLYAGVVLKVDEIKSKFAGKFKSDDPCMPVLLSKKKGAAALAFCPHPEAHGSISAACHRRPPNFNLDAIYKQHSRKATPAELKAGGWNPAKKAKA